MRILAISGSLQRRSSNLTLLEAARSVAAASVEFVIFPSLGDMPHFNPDLEDPQGGAVAELRGELSAADAVLIATPEYAHGMPGSLKNALDWIVGSGELYEKPVGILSAAPSPERGANAREMLERTLRAQGALIVLSSTVHVDPTERARLGPAPRAAVASAVAALVATAQGSRRAP